jgi:hypothetical protein
MTCILKENTNPGIFIPFQMKNINQEAYNKALSHITFKQDNTWVIKIKYMSDTAFFRLENLIKDTLQIEHVIHIPIRNKCKILVLRQTFHIKRNELRVNLSKWNQHLDSEDIRECGSLPEVCTSVKMTILMMKAPFLATVSRQSCPSNMMKRRTRMIPPYINLSLLLKIYLQVSQYPLTYPTLHMKARLSI